MNEKEVKEIIELYKNGSGIEPICKQYKVGKLKVKEILKSNNIEIKKKGKQPLKCDFVVSDYRIKKYVPTDSKKFVAISKIDGTIFNDYENLGGYLTSHIKEKLNIEIPTLYDRRMYYMKTGDYWYEQWFDIVEKDKKMLKKCPYCDWSTIDINNKSGWFKQHLINEHKINIEKHLETYPEDEMFFKKEHDEKVKKEKYSIERNYVICPLCGERFSNISESHLKYKHNTTRHEFTKLHPEIKILSDKFLEDARQNVLKGNLTVSKKRFISKYEKEISDFLIKHKQSILCNRSILIGKEIDILINDKKIGIEFNGLKWHTEYFGKKDNKYHLSKTIQCNEKGYKLLHIFEDEFVKCKDIVFNKLLHILNIEQYLPKIPGRKCMIKEIYMNTAKVFLEKYHIQGFASGTVYLGAYYNDALIAVMVFKYGNIKNTSWELLRFASDYNYICQGVGGKLFKYFIRNYNPYSITSFADRRWTINEDNNVYIKLGFTFESYTKPDYRYYNEKVDKYKRVHKMTLNKKAMHKKYGFPLTMTEKEMTKELGYDRIWDCGLIKYIWKKPS